MSVYCHRLRQQAWSAALIAVWQLVHMSKHILAWPDIDETRTFNQPTSRQCRNRCNTRETFPPKINSGVKFVLENLTPASKSESYQSNYLQGKGSAQDNTEKFLVGSLVLLTQIYWQWLVVYQNTVKLVSGSSGSVLVGWLHNVPAKC